MFSIAFRTRAKDEIQPAEMVQACQGDDRQEPYGRSNNPKDGYRALRITTGELGCSSRQLWHKIQLRSRNDTTSTDATQYCEGTGTDAGRRSRAAIKPQPSLSVSVHSAPHSRRASLLKVQEHVSAHALPLPDAVRPPAQIIIAVRARVQMMAVRPMKPDVHEPPCRAQNTRKASTAHDAVRRPVLLEQRERAFL